VYMVWGGMLGKRIWVGGEKDKGSGEGADGKKAPDKSAKKRKDMDPSRGGELPCVCVSEWVLLDLPWSPSHIYPAWPGIPR
jgi:hypothetical protein